MVAEEIRECREQVFDMWSDIQCDVGDEREEPSNQRTSTYSSRPTAVRTARASGEVRLISSLGHIVDDPSKGESKLHGACHVYWQMGGIMLIKQLRSD